MGKKDQPDMFSDELRKKIYQSSRERIESLWFAALDGDVDWVKEILDEGYHDANGGNRWQADIDPNGWRRTPLHAAVLKGSVPLAKFLLSEGADVNRKTKYGDTPLHFAAEGRELEMVHLLIANGADASKENDDGDTPLDIAMKHGYVEIEKALRT
jgi:hypothetical protein